MLNAFPTNGRAYTVCQVWDITEGKPIPKDKQVWVEDYDSCADLFIVEYRGRIYLALPEELKG